MTQSDSAQDALDVVLEALVQSQRTISLIEARAGEIRRLQDRGHNHSEIVAIMDGPLVVELLSDTIALLHSASGPYRREEARALHTEGVTTARIATMFGVTRQRVSELLQTRTQPTVRPT
jgi:predicted transcriptional regulator